MRFGRRDDADQEFSPDELDDTNNVGWLKRATLAVVFIVILTVAGVGWFMYDQGLVPPGAEQEIPLIRADGQDTKVRPADPGGLEIPHQDKLVFERLAPDQAEPLVERLLPPPELPIERPKVPELPIAGAPPPGLGSPSDAPAPPPAPARSTVAQAPDAGPVEPNVEAPAPEPTDTTEAPTASEAQDAKTAAADPETKDQIAEVIEDLASAAPAPPDEPREAALPATPRDKAPSTEIGDPDSWRVQVASLRNETSAEGEWVRLQTRHSDVLTGLSLNLQRADLDNGTFYRIQAGPLPDRAAAEKVCDRLESRSQGCLVVGP